MQKQGIIHDDEYIRCCAILEVSPDASMGEIKRSYLYLKELYSVDSIASMALDDEFSTVDKQDILGEIEQAFDTLMELEKQAQASSAGEQIEPADDAVLAEAISGIDSFDGPSLKRIREKMGIALDHVAVASRIQHRHLINLEDENFDALPAEVYTRGFVVSYAEYLSLDKQKVVADYMARYRRWKADNRPGGTIANLFTMFKAKK